MADSVLSNFNKTDRKAGINKAGKERRSGVSIDNIENPEAVIDVLVDFLKNKKFDFNKFKIKDIKEKEIIQIIKENKGASFNAIMGKVLERFKDANIKKVIEIIKKNI